MATPGFEVRAGTPQTWGQVLQSSKVNSQRPERADVASEPEDGLLGNRAFPPSNKDLN